MKKKYPLGPYGLTIVLATLFVVAWGLQTYAGWERFVAEQSEHNESAFVFGQGGYVFEWLAATMENWQSEFLQLLSFVVLTSFFIHRGSHESKDSDDQMQEQLDRIERKLEELAAK